MKINEMHPYTYYSAGVKSTQRLADKNIPQGQREIENQRHNKFFSKGDEMLLKNLGITQQDMEYYKNGEFDKLSREKLKKCDKAKEMYHNFMKGHFSYNNGEYKIKESTQRNCKVRLTESQLNRVIKESVRRVLRESQRKEVFTIQGFNNTTDEGWDYPINMLGATYYDYNEACEAAEAAGFMYKDEEDDIDFFVIVGEYETPSGDILGEPDAAECYNNHYGWKKMF